MYSSSSRTRIRVALWYKCTLILVALECSLHSSISCTLVVHRSLGSQQQRCQTGLGPEAPFKPRCAGKLVFNARAREEPARYLTLPKAFPRDAPIGPSREGLAAAWILDFAWACFRAAWGSSNMWCVSLFKSVIAVSGFCFFQGF